LSATANVRLKIRDANSIPHFHGSGIRGNGAYLLPWRDVIASAMASAQQMKPADPMLSAVWSNSG
jgi:hypothetical protein